MAAPPALEILDCPSVSPAVTGELLGIELLTLGLSPSPSTHWTVTCQGKSATVQLFGTVDDTRMPERPATMALDLSSTDEAAWPRLIALAASELAEQRFFRVVQATPQLRALLPRVSVVSYDVKTNKSQAALTLGAALSRLGEGGAWLMGPTLGAELNVGSLALLGSELRVQWGKSALADAYVDWRYVSASAYAGLRRRLEPIEVSVVLGLRVGHLRLKGEPKSVGESGRKLQGPTGGPLLGLRLRTVPARGLFAVANFDVGYALWSVQGTYDNTAPLVTVDGLWTSAALGAGWVF